MIWLGIMAVFVFAVMWGIGFWQYACDEVATAFRKAWDRLK